MIARLRVAWALAKALPIDNLRELLRLVRLHGVPAAARWLAARHTAAVRRRLRIHLGREPTEEELEMGRQGFVGVMEGLT